MDKSESKLLPIGDELRAEFERQHKHRDLRKHPSGKYVHAPVASLWNQHQRTAEWLANVSAPTIGLMQIRRAISLAIHPMGENLEAQTQTAIVNLDLAAIAVHKVIYGEKYESVYLPD